MFDFYFFLSDFRRLRFATECVNVVTSSTGMQLLAKLEKSL